MNEYILHFLSHLLLHQHFLHCRATPRIVQTLSHSLFKLPHTARSNTPRNKLKELPLKLLHMRSSIELISKKPTPSYIPKLAQSNPAFVQTKPTFSRNHPRFTWEVTFEQLNKLCACYKIRRHA